MATTHHRETDKLAAQNRRARHDYFIEDTIEAGVMLLGTEVKSLRAGRASIAESFAAQQGDGEDLRDDHPGHPLRRVRVAQHEPRAVREGGRQMSYLHPSL